MMFMAFKLLDLPNTLYNSKFSKQNYYEITIYRTQATYFALSFFCLCDVWFYVECACCCRLDIDDANAIP